MIVHWITVLFYCILLGRFRVFACFKHLSFSAICPQSEYLKRCLLCHCGLTKYCEITLNDSGDFNYHCQFKSCSTRRYSIKPVINCEKVSTVSVICVQFNRSLNIAVYNMCCRNIGQSWYNLCSLDIRTYILI